MIFIFIFLFETESQISYLWLGRSFVVEDGLVQKMSGIQELMMKIYEEMVYDPWLVDRDEAEANLIRKSISRNRKVRLMTINKDSVLGIVDSKIEDGTEEEENNTKQVERIKRLFYGW